MSSYMTSPHLALSPGGMLREAAGQIEVLPHSLVRVSLCSPQSFLLCLQSSPLLQVLCIHMIVV